MLAGLGIPALGVIVFGLEFFDLESIDGYLDALLAKFLEVGMFLLDHAELLLAKAACVQPVQDL